MRKPLRKSNRDLKRTMKNSRKKRRLMKVKNLFMSALYTGLKTPRVAVH
jgi:hypothetical protein